MTEHSVVKQGQAAPKDLALIFTALETEIVDLKISLAQFFENVSEISDDYLCLIVIQKIGDSTQPSLANGRAVEVITIPAAGVSAARNVGLRAALRRARRIMFVDCRTVLSRSFCQAAFSESARQSPLWGGMVDWRQMPGAAHLAARERAEVDPVHIAYEGFLWRCIFHVELVDDCSFREDIGPGTQSRIQSGEDCLFMRDVIVRHGLRSATIDTSALVERLPRHHLALKERRYAYGAGYRAGQLLRAPFIFRHRCRLTLRCAAFLAQSLRLGLSSAGSQRAIARDRLAGLVHGLREASKK